MKRIVSLDLLRGVAIFSMLASHVLLHTSYHANDLGAVMDMPWLLPLFVVVFILSNFRALFLMVSMTVYGYTLFRGVAKGKDPKALLKKNLIFSVLLFIVALLTESLFANWGILGRSIYHREWQPHWIKRLLHFETLNSIAVSIAFVSIVSYLLTKKPDSRENPNLRKNTIVFLILALIFIVIAPVLQWAIVQSYPDYYSGGNNGAQYSWNGAGDFFLKLFIASLTGVEQPIFPFMASTCFGAIIGMYLAQGMQNIPSNFIKRGKQAASLLIISGFVVFGIQIALEGFSFDALDFHVHPTWFFLFSNGLEILVIFWVLNRYEFNPYRDMDKFIKKSVFFRRWSQVSLTVFVLQVYPEFLVRWIATKITPLEFWQRGQIENGWYVIAIMILVCLFVDALIRLWEKGKFKGTLEWTMAKLSALIAGKKTIKEAKGGESPKIDRLNLKGVLYNPEPIMFVD